MPDTNPNTRHSRIVLNEQSDVSMKQKLGMERCYAGINLLMEPKKNLRGSVVRGGPDLLL